ncbi:membrane protein [Thermosipho melanesiensis]|uniref:Protein HflC n=2 Tax=Thermosipho melanesiensis TaxID=46541 RepID=A6LKP2_THEM4|nr:protease modulator HflC [Thermosipho melanesiensis]ABR30493.1 HflC protein [Thermosipho melanesiensis BI429]APT73644.1 membrane protein [Thermosipho melanesiensis]OOC35586.1 membrane protein [Thermosipho melanesiensis]OOC39260.1 membrane protein [Thermosipho melanesiensis]OOC39346.1 membrane protein [Thermosipho melanesiensis]
MKKLITFLTILVIVIIILSLSMFIVDQTQQAVVLRFGQIVEVYPEAGIHFKTPFVDNVVKFEKRILLYDIEPEKIITLDKKTLIVDTYALWKIKDARKFIETMKTISLAESRIDDIVYSHIRNVFAKHTFDEIISDKREGFLKEVTLLSKNDLDDFGIEVIDVRVKHADLPAENVQAVYERMRAERYSIAAQIRAEGQKEAQKIRAEADKQVAVILAQAKSEAEAIKGTGEASATKIYAEAFKTDPEFFDLWRSLSAYDEIFKNGTIIFGKDLEIFKYIFGVK